MLSGDRRPAGGRAWSGDRAAAVELPDAIEPFDLMPGTAQVETLVRLRRPPRAGRRGAH